MNTAKRRQGAIILMIAVVVVCTTRSMAFLPNPRRRSQYKAQPILQQKRLLRPNRSPRLSPGSALSVLKFPSFTEKETITKTVSAASLVLLDVAFRRIFSHYGISFPSSLGGCGILLATLLAMPNQVLFSKLSPGAGLLAKWLPLFFVPSLVTLPLAQSLGPPIEIAKLGAVVVGGFFFTLLTTAASVAAVRKLATNHQGTVIAEDKPPSSGSPKNAPKAFSDETFHFLTTLTLGALGLLTVGKATGVGNESILSMAFFLLTTISTFVWGARLPASFAKVVHPLITCTALTWTAMGLWGKMCGQSFRSLLQAYRTGVLSPLGQTGPGDILLFLLGPAVVSLAVAMYDRRKLMRDNMAAVGTAVGVSTLGGVFGTALAARALRIANQSLRLSLLSRNVTSPLAMTIAAIVGADISLAVSFVAVTGLFGANFGASILDAFGIKDATARGLGIGAAAHGLGTAAFVDEKDAFPFAAISMALTASAATVVVSIPVIKRLVLKLALG